MSKIKLTYLKQNAKGAVPRAILSYSKTPFENITYTDEEFKKLKLDNLSKKDYYFEYNQVPILEVNGKKLAQAHAINTYLSKVNNLYGDNDFEGAEITSIISSYEDAWTKFRPIFKQVNDMEVKLKDQIKKDFFDKHAQTYLEIYERRYVKNNKGFFIGKRFSGADIWICVMLFNMFKHPIRIEEYGGLISKYAPNLEKHIDNIRKNELSDFFNEKNKDGFMYDALV